MFSPFCSLIFAASEYGLTATLVSLVQTYFLLQNIKEWIGLCSDQVCTVGHGWVSHWGRMVLWGHQSRAEYWSARRKALCLPLNFQAGASRMLMLKYWDTQHLLRHQHYTTLFLQLGHHKSSILSCCQAAQILSSVLSCSDKEGGLQYSYLHMQL